MRYTKLKEWYFDNAGYERERNVVDIFQRWFNKGNLVLKLGSGRNVEEIFGLPYTSTSDYAAVWNCQAIATLKGKPNWYFEGVAITEDMNIVAVFSVCDKEENEVDWQDVVIGKF